MARVWIQTLGVGLAAAAALCAAGPASALTLGPAPDFYQVVSASDSSPLYATAWAPPVMGVQQPALRGQVQITLAPGAAPVPVLAFGYLSTASGRFDTGMLTFTSIFGIAASAPLAPYPGTGSPWEPPWQGCCGTSGGHEQPIPPPFNPGPYALEGASGSTHLSRPVRLVTLSDLPAALGSEFDLSPFAGDPAGLFHIFQTDLPASELLSPVPEPGSGLLLVAGLALLACRPWPRRPGAAAIV